MPGQGRLKDRFKNLLHTLVPARNRSPSPSTNPSIRLTRDLQASSVGHDSTSIRGIPDTQPLNLPSSSNIYPSIVINPAGDETPGRMADLAHAGFQGVKTTLRLVERATDVFPPLKSTVAGLLGVIDIVEVGNSKLSVVMVMVMTDPRQPLRTNRITKI